MQSLCHPLSSMTVWPSNIIQNVVAISFSSLKGRPGGLKSLSIVGFFR